MISNQTNAFESLYNFWPSEGMRNQNRLIPPRKSYDTLGAHMNSNTSLLFNTPMKHYDDQTELLMEDDVQSAVKGGQGEESVKDKEEQDKLKDSKMETESNRFSRSCMPQSSSLQRAKSSDTTKSVDNRTKVDY